MEHTNDHLSEAIASFINVMITPLVAVTALATLLALVVFSPVALMFRQESGQILKQAFNLFRTPAHPTVVRATVNPSYDA